MDATATKYINTDSTTKTTEGDSASIYDAGAVYATEEEYSREIRKYRTEIPNVVFEMGLTGAQIALYAHIKRRAGGKEGGECTEGLRGIARHLRRSKDSVSRDLDILVDKGLVEVGPQDRKDHPRPITVTDIWPDNYEHFTGRRLTRGTRVSHHKDRVSRVGDRASRQKDRGVSPGGQKKEPKKNEPSKNATSKEEGYRDGSEDHLELNSTGSRISQRCVEKLSVLSNFPPRGPDIRELIDDLSVEFSKANPERVCGDYVAWVLDNGDRVYNHRALLRRFFENSHEAAEDEPASGMESRAIPGQRIV